MTDEQLRRAATRVTEQASGAAWEVSIGTGTVAGYTALSRDVTVTMDSDGGTLSVPLAVTGYVPFAGDRVLVAGPAGAPHVVAVVDRNADVGIIFDGSAARVVNPTNTQARDLYARRFRGDLGAPNDGFNGYGVWHGNVDYGGVPGTYVSSGLIQSAGDITAGGSVGANNNLVAQGSVIATRADISGPVTAIGNYVLGAFVKSTGNINADGAVGAVGNVTGSGVISTGDVNAGRDVNASRSVGAVQNVVAGNSVLGAYVHSDGDIECSGSMRAYVSVAAITGNVLAKGVILTSDEQLKDGVHDLEDADALFAQLRPRRFRWRDRDDDAGAEELGFVAQELPQEVQRVSDEEAGTLGYDLGPVVTLTVAELQRLTSRVAELEQTTTSLHARLEALEA